MAAIRRYKSYTTTKSYKCYYCDPPTNHVSRSSLHAHKARYHKESYGGALQPLPWNDDEDPFQDFPVLDEIREIYLNNEMYILTPHVTDDIIIKQFNFPLKGHVTNLNLQMHMRYIYNHPAVQNAYSVQMGAGVILYNRAENYYRYFRPSINMYILQNPLRIWNRASLDAAINQLIDMDVDAIIRNFRPDSAYNVVFITNIEYYVFVSDFPLRGSEDGEYNLPQYLEGSHAVVTKFKICGYEKACVFVALAQHFKSSSDARRVVTEVNKLFQQWVEYCNLNGNMTIDSDIKKFKGVPLSQISKIEECFQINIDIFRLKPDKTVLTEFTSQAPYEEKVYLNLYKDHINLIRADRIDSYCKAYACRYCGHLHKRRYACMMHEKICMKMSKIVFQNGYYRYGQNLFERLENVGIFIPTHLRCKSHFVVFDFEAILEENSHPGRGQLKFTHTHKLVSAAFGSSVEGYTDTRCIVHPDQEHIIQTMFEYFAEVREQAIKIEMAEFESYLDELEYKLNAEKQRVLACLSIPSSDLKERRKAMKACPIVRQYVRLLRDVYMFISQLPILGFNSSSYDLNLATNLIIQHLWKQEDQKGSGREPWLDSSDDENQEEEEEEDEDEEKGASGNHDESDEYLELAASEDFDCDALDEHNIDVDIEEVGFDPTFIGAGPFTVIKKSKVFVALYNAHYKFQDIKLYLPPATSLDGFLQAFEAPCRKFYFPYAHLTSYEKLSDPLPAYPSKSWYNDLRNCDLLQNEHDIWLRGGCKGAEPQTGMEKYKMIQQVWQEKDMKELKCLLSFYNSLDVSPTITALSTLCREFYTLGVDALSEACTVAGVSRRIVFKYAQKKNIVFPQIQARDADLYYLIRRSICGGISLISKRLCEEGKTYLTPEKKTLTSRIHCKL